MEGWKTGRNALVITVVLAVGVSIATARSPAKLPVVPEDQVKKITAAMPRSAPARAARPRKILVFWLCEGFYHRAIPVGNKCLELMGKKTGAFAVETSNDMAVFTPDRLKAFDAVVFNNTTRLSFKDPAHRKALMDFVKAGKGVVGIHGATDNFYTWPEAAAMMGGLFDGHPWTAGGTWAVKLDQPDHPINKGFGGKAFKIRDEIYQLKAPYSRKTHRVLLSLDMSDPATAGRGGQKRKDKDHAISMIRPFGKGRVFYCSLGHNNEIFWNPAVLRHYLAGIQYALGDLKVDDTPVSKTAAATAPAGPWKQIPAYKAGLSRSALTTIEAEIRKGGIAAYPKFESRLLTVIEDPKATNDAKAWACRQLRMVGSGKSVPALLKRVRISKLSHAALYALQGMKNPKVDEGLRTALAATEGRCRIGVINTLGARRDADSVDALARLAADKDTPTAEAAVKALARIGTADADKALAAAKVLPTLALQRLHARIACADRLLANGKPGLAGDIAEALSARGHPATIRIAALRIRMRTEQDGAAELLAALKDPDPAVAKAAGKFCCQLPAKELTTGLMKELPGLPDEIKVVVLGTLAACGDAAALPAVVAQLKSTNDTVRVAAIGAAGQLGNAKTVPLLIAALTDQPSLSNAVSRALATLRDPAVDAALCGMVPKAPAGQAIIVIGALEARRAGPPTGKAMLDLVRATTDNTVRQAAVGLLGKAGTTEDLAGAVALLAEKPTSTLQRAVVAIARREADPARRLVPISAAMAKATGKTKVSLIQVLARLPDKRTLDLLRRELKSTNADARNAAAQALGDWPDPAPLPDLHSLVKTTADVPTQVIAIRGLIRLVTLPTRQPRAKSVAVLAEVLKAAKRPEEKKAVLAVLPKLACPEAMELARSCQADKTLAASAAAAVKAMQAPTNKKRPTRRRR